MLDSSAWRIRDETTGNAAASGAVNMTLSYHRISDEPESSDCSIAQQPSTTGSATATPRVSPDPHSRATPTSRDRTAASAARSASDPIHLIRAPR